ncbi:TPA: hypothetical protein ACKFCW_001999 [Citrobacter farmeri]
MDSNIIELVKLGHERANELKASCGAVDVRSLAQLISDLATQLEVQLTRGNAQAVQLANAESKCGELAAEVQAVKSAALEEIEVINRGGQAYCVKDGMSVNPIYARGWNDYRAKSLSVETPATDAFLAEVRAQAKADGVQEYADSFRHSASKIRECHGDTIRVRALLHEANNADEFAAQLRKGVQS